MSSTYISNAILSLVTGLVVVLPFFGWEIVDAEMLTSGLTGLIVAVVAAGTAIYNFYGRFKAGGINAFGLRKRKAE